MTKEKDARKRSKQLWEGDTDVRSAVYYIAAGKEPSKQRNFTKEKQKKFYKGMAEWTRDKVLKTGVYEDKNKSSKNKAKRKVGKSHKRK